VGRTIKVGVRVLYPPGLSNPPSPESIQSASGELPEYIMRKNPRDPNDRTWVSYVPGTRTFHYRARTDLILVVDAKVVNTNRISIPAGTPVLEKSFTR